MSDYSQLKWNIPLVKTFTGRSTTRVIERQKMERKEEKKEKKELIQSIQILNFKQKQQKLVFTLLSNSLKIKKKTILIINRERNNS